MVSVPNIFEFIPRDFAAALNEFSNETRRPIQVKSIFRFCLDVVFVLAIIRGLKMQFSFSFISSPEAGMIASGGAEVNHKYPPVAVVIV